MFIVFACPGMPFRGDTIESGKSLGGSETACYYVAREMAASGHRVTVFTTDPHANGKWDGVDYAFCGAQSPQYPVGDLLQSFIESAECDALVVQRAAGIMRMPHCAKTAFWWLHDLALVRSLPAVRQDSFHYDGVFAVSEWHKRQVHDVWDFPLDVIRVLPNAVDRTLYEGLQEPHLPAELALIYQSRYERGIDYLIRPGGIMDQLATKRPRAKLYVCGYQNEPEHMRGYYEQVRNRIRSMPNAELLGYLSKRDLARLQSAADILVYPGEFEETSCITAMEAQCAGLPFVASECGALPETCEGAGAKLIPLKDGRCDEEAFVKYLCGVNEDTLKHMREQQRAKAETISWSKSADVLEQAIAETLAAKQRNRFSMLRSMLDRSDIMFAREYVKRSANGAGQSPEARELAEQYAFAEDLAAHYDSDAALAALEADQSLDVTENTRFRFVREELTRAGDVTNVLDYGCQKGHFLFSLAKTLGPGVRYTGIEISKRTVEWAQKRFAELGLAGEVTFKQGDALAEDFDYGRYGKFDALILGEVLEHVPDPVKLCSRLEPLLVDGARVVITTPYGEWEGKEYHDRPDQARFHLHHFELSDLHDMFAHHDGFVVIGAAAGRSAHGTLGSYIVSFTWRAGQPLAKPVDYERKLREYTPRQTLSFCALAKDSERTILRSLMSVKDVADEFVIALDKTSSDGTRAILERFRDQFCRFRRFVILDAESPLEIGFDEARNRTLREARGDWIMWMDTDEDLIHPERLHKYLRHNMFDGYGIAQHHMSADPVGVLTTDWPVRVFRNVPYLRFQGVVHEHPDDVERPNSGPRAPAQIVDLHILHHGYTTEDVRRRRFQRNLPLIKRDRKQYPDRLLGRLLWMRDLAHMCMFEAERTGGVVTEEMRNWAKLGMLQWEALLEESDRPIAARMLRDGLEFYSTLVGVLGEGFEAHVQLHAAKGAPARLEAGPRRAGRFLNRQHFEKFMKLCIDEQTQKFDSRYF